MSFEHLPHLCAKWRREVVICPGAGYASKLIGEPLVDWRARLLAKYVALRQVRMSGLSGYATDAEVRGRGGRLGMADGSEK